MKYSKPLDLLAYAVVCQQAGQTERAVQSFMAAVKSPEIASALQVINASNAKAMQELTSKKQTASTQKVGACFADRVIAANKQARQVASSWPFAITADLDPMVDSDEPGEELRIMPEENTDRIVQEADADENTFLEDEDGEDEAEEETEEAKATTASMRFARYVRNEVALAAAKKKAPAKKVVKKK